MNTQLLNPVNTALQALIETGVNKHINRKHVLLPAPEAWGIHYQVRATSGLPLAAVYLATTTQPAPPHARWRVELPHTELITLNLTELLTPSPNVMKEATPMRTNFPVQLNPWTPKNGGQTRLYVNGNGYKAPERNQNLREIFVDATKVPEDAKVWLEDDVIKVRGCSLNDIRPDAATYLQQLANPF